LTLEPGPSRNLSNSRKYRGSTPRELPVCENCALA
jgi:hypothetical protein